MSPFCQTTTLPAGTAFTKTDSSNLCRPVDGDPRKIDLSLHRVIEVIRENVQADIGDDFRDLTIGVSCFPNVFNCTGIQVSPMRCDVTCKSQSSVDLGVAGVATDGSPKSALP